MPYAIGDVVFFSLSHTVAGKGTFIGRPRGDKVGKVLILAIGAEVDEDKCSPTGRSHRHRGEQYRQRFFENHPHGPEGESIVLL